MRQVLLGLSLWVLTGLALASERGQELKQSVPQAMSQLQVAIPVSWEMSTSGSSRSRVASISESYAELWTYQQYPYSRSYLKSPRSRVPVYAVFGENQPGRMPKLLVIGEQQLASLLGIELRERSAQQTRQIILDLMQSAEHENVITLQPGRDEMVSLIISFHN